MCEADKRSSLAISYELNPRRKDVSGKKGQLLRVRKGLLSRKEIETKDVNKGEIVVFLMGRMTHMRAPPRICSKHNNF